MSAERLIIFLNILLLFTSFLVLTSSNPVHSVLFLILTFCEASCILLLFKVDFLGLLFIIIYVGAIAVLFLFVIMMLDLKIANFFSARFLIFILPIGTFAFVFLNFFFSKVLSCDNFLLKINSKNFLIDSLNSIECFGQILFNFYTPCFLLAGLVLLVSMLGAIVLTLNFQFVKTKFSRSGHLNVF